MRRCRLYFSLGTWFFLLPMAGGQEILQPAPTLPLKTILSPQAFIGENSPPLSLKDVAGREVDLTIRTPPGTEVVISGALRSKSNQTRNEHRFTLPSSVLNPEIRVTGPFGGKIDAGLRLGKEAEQRLEIAEGLIEASSSNPDPSALAHLPALCPRLISTDGKARIPEKMVYDGGRDWMISPSHPVEGLYLTRASLAFDFEDPSILVGMNPHTREWLFDQRGGYYSNIHYAVFPYNPALESLLKKMEPDLITLRGLEKKLRENAFSAEEFGSIQRKFQKSIAALHGRGRDLGPYQVLMHLIFGTLDSTPKAALARSLGAPSAHGFLPGPFLGSIHWNYPLCEWGDTAGQASPQALRYRNFPLWAWEAERGDEKRILILLEGDDQLKKSPSRLALEKEGVLRSFDYTDDLIGFFVVGREETLPGKTLTTPFDFMSLEVKTE